MPAHVPFHAPATRSAYASDWRHFAAWCAATDAAPLPADVETVVAYLTHCAERLRPATIQRRLVAIAARHKAERLDSPTRHPDVAAVMHGIRRTLGTAPAQKDPVTRVQLRRMVDGLGSDPPGIRDRAVLLLGFTGAFRRSEIAGLDVGDLQERPEGLLVTLRRSKTDQEGRGRQVPIPRGSHPQTCPVRAVQRWLELLRAADLATSTGPLFRVVDAHHNIRGRISGAGVARVVKRAAKRAGLDPHRYGGHSLRAGFVTEAFEAGVSELRIAEQTGHRSLDVLRGYIRRQDPFRSTAAGELGL